MTRKELEQAIVACVESMRAENVPRDKGNMAFNALRYAVVGNEFVIWIDDGIAPYAPYTEYPWTSPRWNGKKNPNEGWWLRFREELASRIAKSVGGEIT